MRLTETIGVICTGLLLGGCSTNGNEDGAAVTGSCAGGQCTGVCVDEVKNYAREKLGSVATDVYFSFGDDDPAALSAAVVYFRTEECPTGQYQAQFYGTSVSCNNTYRGRLPENVGKLLVVPKGCKG